MSSYLTIQQQPNVIGSSLSALRKVTGSKQQFILALLIFICGMPRSHKAQNMQNS